MQELPLNGFYSGESRKLSDRRCINFIPTPSDSGSLSSLSIFPTTGRDKDIEQGTTFNALAGTNIDVANKVTSNSVVWTANNVSSLIYIKDQAVVAIGDDIVESRLLTYDAGTVQPDGERVRIATSPNTLVAIGYGRKENAISPNNYYIQYTIGNSFSWTLHDEALSSAPIIDTVYYGGRFLYCNYSSDDPKVYYSALTSPDAVDLDFLSPDDNNSFLKGVAVFSNTLYVFGEFKTYMYQVTTNTDLPFRSIGSLDVGLYSPESKVVTNNGIYIVGKNGSQNYNIYLISGAGYKKVSSLFVDKTINENDLYTTYGPTPDGDRPIFPVYAPVFKISDNSNSVVCFNFPNQCLCLDENTGIWHERKTEGRDNWDVVTYGMSPLGPIFVSDTWESLGGTAYDTNIAGENIHSGLELGELMHREVITSPFNFNNERMILSEIQPQCEVDYSEPVDGWYDSKILMSMSYDFGNSFDQERSLSIGQSGDYTSETRFLGMSYVRQAFTVMLRVVSPYPTRIIKLLSRSTKGSF